MTAPITCRRSRPAHFDLVWFGVIMTIVMEMGLIHPPRPQPVCRQKHRTRHFAARRDLGRHPIRCPYDFCRRDIIYLSGNRDMARGGRNGRMNQAVK
jgi:hypothetical protein